MFSLLIGRVMILLTPTLWNNPITDLGVVPSGNEDIIIPSGLTNYPGSASQDYTIAQVNK